MAIYPLPYLEPNLDGPALLPPATPGDPPPPRLAHEEVIRLALARIQADRARRAGLRAVLVAHTFVAGGASSESERELSVGNVERVSVTAFTGFDYVALGHLHGSQELDGPRLAYSGTPLPYSFSEERHVKSVRLVELGDNGSVAVQRIPLGVGRPLRTVEGRLEDLLRDPGLESARSARLRVRLTDENLPLQAMARLRPRFPHIAELRHLPGERPAADGGARLARIEAALSPLQRTLAFFGEQQGRDPTPAEVALLREALESARPDRER